MINRKSVRPKIPFMILVLGIFAISLNTNLIKVALPSFMEDFQIDTVRLMFITIGYTFFQAVFTPIMGKLGDAFEHNKVILAGYTVFLLGSVLGGNASGFYGVLLGRFIQGIGAAAVVPNTFISGPAMFPPEKRGWSLGLLVSTLATAALMGPALGGLLMEFSGWRILFLLNIPIMAAVISLFLPCTKRRRAVAPKPPVMATMQKAVNLSLVLGLWIILLNVGALFGLLSPYFLASAAAFLGLAFLYYHQEKRSKDHFIDLNLFVNKSFRSGFFSGSINFAVVYGIAFIMPLLLAIEYGMSPGRIGLILTVANVVRFVVSPLSGRLTDRYGNRLPVQVGFITLFFAMALLYSYIRVQSSGFLYISMILIGAGSGIVPAPTLKAVQDNSTRGSQGAIMGIYNSIRYISGMMGQIVLGVLLQPLQRGMLKAQSSPLFDRALGFMALVVVLGYFISRELSGKEETKGQEGKPARPGYHPSRG